MTMFGHPVELFQQPILLGGHDAQQKLFSAVRTYDSALRQRRDSVATTLFVAAMEALAVPRANFFRQQPTKRFIEFHAELIPDALDQAVRHANFEDSFGLERGNKSASTLRKLVLDEVYTRRSATIHSGVSSSNQSFMRFDGGQMARALVQDLADSAIRAYRDCPRSSLVGSQRGQSGGK